jgi:RNA polymerase sigma-70 factor (ECF subfamily)
MPDEDPYGLRPLLERVQNGERQAYNELFEKLRPYLRALVRRHPGWRVGLDQSDLVSSSLRRIYENLDDFLLRGPSVPHLIGWIKRIVKNRVTDQLRKLDRDPLGGPGADAAEVPERRDSQHSAARDRVAVRVAAALARLPERQRLVVEWHWFDRLRDAEISARIGGSVEAIRVLRCRALKALRAHMEEPDDDE